MQNILEGDNETLRILREQLSVSTVAERKMTGVGFFLHFKVPQDAPRIPENPDLIISNPTQAQIEGMENGAGFILWIKAGILNQLEGYCYGEPWLDEVRNFRLKPEGQTTIKIREKSPE